MFDQSLFGKLEKKYGPGFHLKKPLGAMDYYQEQTFDYSPATIANGQQVLLCQTKLLKKKALVLHEYGVRGEILVPSTDFVGFVWKEISANYLQGKLSWKLEKANQDSLGARTTSSDGVSVISGVSSFQAIAYGSGGQSIYGFSGETFKIRVTVNDVTAGGDIPPDGMRIIAFTNGYMLDI